MTKEPPQIQFEGDSIKLIFNKYRTDLSLLSQYMDEYHSEVDELINKIASKLDVTYDEAIKILTKK